MRALLSAGAVWALCAVASFAGEPADVWYADASAQLLLPQGGAGMRRLAGAGLRVGAYAADALAFEAEASWLEDSVGLGLRALWALRGWEEYDRLFGFSRFDPFLSFGARGWLHDGQVGPCAGCGALYYLTDEWALRADADMTLGLDAGPAALFALSVGVQRTF